MIKKPLIISIFILLALVSTVMSSVVNTRHNMASWSPYDFKATNETEVCKFCHTPHGASPAVPLWSHKSETVSFTRFSSATLVVDNPGLTYDYGYNDPLGGTSKLCMGCHDGATALGALVTGETIVMDTNDYITGAGDYGSDISNKHPVSFIYNNNLITEMDATGLSVKALGKYGLPSTTDNGTIINPDVKKKWERAGNRVECTICHDPHTNRASAAERDYLPFWVSSTISGVADSFNSVCLACHSDPFSEWTSFCGGC